MPPVDVSALTGHVQAVLTDPHAEVSATGTPSLDTALALLRRRRHAEQPLETPHPLGFWYALPQRADVPG